VTFKVIIPARYASTRLPGKPLLTLAGKPMLQHVYERAMDSGAQEVVIATDDERIRTAALRFGARVCMTSRQHRSGTDRIAEAVRLLQEPSDQIIVNVQGDEPLLAPPLVGQVADLLACQPQADVATLCERLASPAQLFDPHVVKVVCNRAGAALYFSRAPIPWYREQSGAGRSLPDAPLHYRHIGIYAYRVAYLLHYTGQSPCALEQSESLEQLRVLYEGGRIQVAEAAVPTGPGVDTPEDLETVRRLLASP
jgi:3-deoxy-manno-octulosonate cytidylyltransferase (CMP-KDO synthetase)